MENTNPNLMKHSRKRPLVLLLFCSLMAVMYAQNTLVNGKVVDEAGEPIIGASVLQLGTTTGTVTNFEGQFSLSVPAGSMLKISYIGYITQEVRAVAGRLMVITLVENLQNLDEVVVVGYGTQKKSDITGSVTSVPRERLSKLPVNNVLQSIQGVAPGVTVTQSSSIPGDAPSVLVRGKGSINASTDPYIVVDGIPLTKTDGSINDINPNDIASVEILKDASATAIYGTNGANGVILITTKRGTSEKPVIRYNGYIGTEEIAHILEPGSPQQIIERYAEYARIQKVSNYNGSDVRYQAEYDNYLAGRTTDWIDAVSQNAFVQDHNVSISGGSQYARYYISGDYLDQKGVIKGYNYKRYSLRTNLDVNVTDYMQVGLNSYVVAHNRDGGRANLLNAAAMSPWASVYELDANGNSTGKLVRYPMYSETLWSNPLLNTTLNPERRQWNISLNGYAEVDFGKIYQPLSGLKYKFNAGFSYVPKRTSQYQGETVYNVDGWGQIYNEESQTWTVENIISYARDFGVHHIDLTGLYAAKRKKYQSATAEASKFPLDDLSWGNLGTGATPVAKSYIDLYTTLSQMGRINYSYDSKYLFTFTVRRDGSSVFGADHKYGVFPSVALGWNAMRESFMQPLEEVLNNLKLRLSYGETGNEAISVYRSLTLMDNSTLAMGGATHTTISSRSSMGNNMLGWETTRSFNLGIDFGLYGNRINGSIDVYRSTTNDLLMRRRLPNLVGYADVWTNMGKTKNTGLEITINSRNIATRNFTWATTLVFATNKNELVELYGDGLDDVGNRWFLGHPLGVIYDYTVVGIWQEDEIAAKKHEGWDSTAKAGDLKLADLSGADGKPDGKIDDNDRSILGQTTPKWTGGLTNTLTYKDLTLSIFINTVQGHMRNNTQLSVASDEMGRRNGPAEIGYWTPENKSNEWRSLGNSSNSHGYGFPRNAGFTRIKDVTLSYNLPVNIVKKIGLNAVQVYASGRNLYTFTDWLGWDPEARDISRGSTDWEINYPVTRSYVLGLNVTF